MSLSAHRVSTGQCTGKSRQVSPSGAGGIELVATLLAMKHNVAPPTVNYLGTDAECDLDYAPNEAKPRLIRNAIKQSFAFGGLNAVLALRKEVAL